MACQLSFSMVPAPQVPRRHLGCRGAAARVPPRHLGPAPEVPPRHLGCRGAAPQVPPRHPKLANLRGRPPRVPECRRARLPAVMASGKRSLTQMVQQATSDASSWLDVHADDVQPDAQLPCERVKV